MIFPKLASMQLTQMTLTDAHKAGESYKKPEELAISFA